ncbi:hypothetical protein [Streptomyces sp. NPDC059168]|uniref:hypothetical protein n=1 Tax=Streptomyces sp. NPDC059168 TaxID=3346753 RepID=UPI0036A0025C
MRRRWARVVAITIVVLAVLLTVADRVAVHYAAKEATRLAAEKYGYVNTTDGHLAGPVPENVGFTTARATSDGARIGTAGHLVNLGSARFTG